MTETKTYENFPFRMSLMSNLFALSIYATGALILMGYGAALAALYIVYCAGVEFRVMKKGCVNCYYYGKDCGIGKGRLCSALFKKGDPSKFAKATVSRIDLVPDFLIIIFPLGGGIVLLIRNFSVGLAALVALITLLGTVGNYLVRSSYACRFCKQREIGCPAEKLFSKQ
jgi:hypothetical protein